MPLVLKSRWILTHSVPGPSLFVLVPGELRQLQARYVFLCFLCLLIVHVVVVVVDVDVDVDVVVVVVFNQFHKTQCFIQQFTACRSVLIRRRQVFGAPQRGMVVWKLKKACTRTPRS